MLKKVRFITIVALACGILGTAATTAAELNLSAGSAERAVTVLADESGATGPAPVPGPANGPTPTPSPTTHQDTWGWG